MEQSTEQPIKTVADDYSEALTSARIAFYDDFKSAPRVTEIKPTTTAEFIENMTSTIYNQSHEAGGQIGYTIIREVTENFIHAQFREIVVSIFDKGNTIRFADQGPGISQKEKAQQPGFSSATAPMKQYIRGVGSGFPLVKEYLSFSQGRITIEDNINSGSVITISINKEEKPSPHADRQDFSMPTLNERERTALTLFNNKGALRVTDLKEEMGLANSSAANLLTKLEEKGLIERVDKARILTSYGSEVADHLF